jgi:hypothetical protein
MLAPKKPCGLNRVARAFKEGAIVVACDVLPIIIISAFVVGVDSIIRLVLYVGKRNVPELFGLLAILTLWRVRSGAKYYTHTNSEDPDASYNPDALEKGYGSKPLP